MWYYTFQKKHILSFSREHQERVRNIIYVITNIKNMGNKSNKRLYCVISDLCERPTYLHLY